MIEKVFQTLSENIIKQKGEEEEDDTNIQGGSQMKLRENNARGQSQK